MSGSPPSGVSRRLVVAGLVAGLHLALQVAVYAAAFAAGPGGATRKVLGVSLYGVASVLTFPFVPLAERLGWSGVGVLAFPLNSVAWGACVYLAWGLVRRGGGGGPGGR